MKLNRSGLTLIELIVSMLVLAVGILGLAAGTGWVIRSVDLARLETHRTAAFQAAMEEVRATPLEELNSGAALHGHFELSWSIEEEAPGWKRMQVVVVGPGRTPGSVGAAPGISPVVADTFEYLVGRR